MLQQDLSGCTVGSRLATSRSGCWLTGTDSTIVEGLWMDEVPSESEFEPRSLRYSHLLVERCLHLPNCTILGHFNALLECVLRILWG